MTASAQQRRDKAFTMLVQNFGRPMPMSVDLPPIDPGDNIGLSLTNRYKALASVKLRLELVRSAGLVGVLMDGLSFTDLERHVDDELQDTGWSLHAWLETRPKPSSS